MRPGSGVAGPVSPARRVAHPSRQPASRPEHEWRTIHALAAVTRETRPDKPALRTRPGLRPRPAVRDDRSVMPPARSCPSPPPAAHSGGSSDNRGRPVRLSQVPPPVAAVRQLFSAYGCPWWIAGGWALDLAAGRQSRAHSDVDVLVLARDREALAAAFAGFVPVVQHRPAGQQRPLGQVPVLEPGPDSVRLRGYPDLEIILARTEGTGDGEEWVYHRGSGRIRLPLGRVGAAGFGGVPVLTPEVVLLFSARSGRPKDDADFRGMLPRLSRPQASWLLGTLPGDHPWRPDLQRALALAAG